MKEADKRARITVAYGGLILLRDRVEKDPNNWCTRTHLFALPKDGEKVTENIKAMRTKSWQRDYVQRLVDAGILAKMTRAGQELYYPPDLTTITQLIDDHDNYGLRLSRFLFPREAGIPLESPEEGGDEESESGGSEADEEEVVESTDGGIIQMDGASVTALLRLLRTLEEGRLMHATLMKAVLDQYKLVEEGVNRDREERQADREFPSYVKNRFKELDAKMGKVEEALNFSGRTLTRMDAAVNSLSSMVSSLAHNLTLAIPTSLSQELTKKLRAVIGLPEKQTLLEALENKGSLRDTLAEFRVRLQDLRAVEELALKAVESSEKSEVTNER